MGEIFKRAAPSSSLPWTGERLTTETTGQVEIEHLHRYFVARALCRGLDVLDIASGEGYGSALLAQTARNVVGVEIEEATVEHARAAYGSANLTFRQGDARHIPCADDSFDAVVSFETLEHFYEHDQFIAEVRRVLRPGGMFIISSPERDVYSPADGPPNPYHAHELTHGEFATLLRSSFGYVSIYAQRPLLGSALIAEELPPEPAPLLTFEKRGTQFFEASIGLPRPIYLVAVASDNVFVPHVGSLYVETSGVEALFAASAAAKNSIEALTERLTEQGDYAQRVQAELNRRDAELAKQVEESHSWHRQLVQRTEEQTLLGAEVASLTERLLHANARLDMVQSEIRDAVALETASVTERLSWRDAELQVAQAEVQRLAQQLARRNTDYTELVQAHGVLLAERAARYAQREAAYVAELERQAAQSAATEASLRAQLVHTSTGAATRETEVLDWRAEAGRQQARAEDAENHLLAVLGSSSWRLTGPVRGLAARHPTVIIRAKGFLRRHPAAPRVAVRFARGIWRALTMRSLRTSGRTSSVPKAPPPEPEPSPPAPTTAAPPQLSAQLFRNVTLAPAFPPPEAPLLRGNGRRLLCVGHVMPFPPRTGNEYRIHRMLAWFAEQGWEILVVVCPLQHEMPSEQRLADAAAIYPSLLVLDRSGTLHHRLAAGSRLLEGLRLGSATDIPTRLGEDDEDDPAAARLLRLQRTFCPDPLVELLLHLQNTFAPNLLLAEYVFMTRPLQLLNPDIVTAIDTIDVFSTKASKVERYGLTDGLALSEKEEAGLLRQADILIGIQPDEARNLARLAPDRNVVSVGVDFPVSRSAVQALRRNTLLLVASGNPMNVKGLSDFLLFCWPAVCRDFPDIELLVAGAVGESVRDVPSNVRLLGQVEALGPLYEEARVVINPTLAGTGLKIKTVEALSHLRPVVCWPSGVDGLSDEARTFCHVATSWFDFANHLKRLMFDDEAAFAIVHARALLEHVFSPRVVYGQLAEALHDV